MGFAIIHFAGKKTGSLLHFASHRHAAVLTYSTKSNGPALKGCRCFWTKAVEIGEAARGGCVDVARPRPQRGA